MPARLMSLDYRVPQCDTSLAEVPVLIGCADDAQIRLSDPSVGYHHCEIDRFNGRMIVRDLDSLHGTFVNGARIRESELNPGDHLAVGMLTLLVQSFADKRTDYPVVEDRGGRKLWQDEILAVART